MAPGTYNENAVITTSSIKLKGHHATLNGTGLSGIGILVDGAHGVHISGFTVQGFEAGIVLDGASFSRVHKNVLRDNRSHENDRAGIAVLGLSTDNFITGNNATGNGVADVSPSFTYDLFDAGPLDNTWRRNRGSSNF